MTLRTVKDIKRFQNAIQQCKDNVWLRSINGQNYNLKSAISQYIGIAKVLSGRKDLELFTDIKDDEKYFLRMFSAHPEML